MHLTWTPTGDGARFVLFADAGAPIPPRTPGVPLPRVLRVTLQRPETAGGFAIDTTRVWHVTALEVLGADATGGAVPDCGAVPDLAVARICMPTSCDLDANGISDVRDLVRMVGCLRGTLPCPAAPSLLDCDGNGTFDLDDVLCCARVVLGLPRGGHADTTRAEPRIALTFGEPARTGDVLEVPVHVSGADRIGAARLRFELPLAGAQWATLGRPTAGDDWLTLDQWNAGGLTAGLIALPASSPAGARPSGTLDLVLRLGLAPGAAATGVVTLTAGEFSGPDGVMLATDFGTPVVRLGGAATLTLEPARPNPFANATAVRLTLDADAVVELGIYDLAGRRLATLHSGPLTLGLHTYVWDGRRDDGTRAHSGVYFARASLAGRGATVRKLVLVRGD
jgi:hypothetical protein